VGARGLPVVGSFFGVAGGSRPGVPACWRGVCAGGLLWRFALAVPRAGCCRLLISDLALFVVRFAPFYFSKKNYASNEVRVL
jgi:hypothetical protein